MKNGVIDTKVSRHKEKFMQSNDENMRWKFVNYSFKMGFYWEKLRR